MLGVVSLAATKTLAVDATTHVLFTPAVNASTHAAGKDTDVSNIIAFFNPLANTTAKKPWCNMLRGCFKITPSTSVGMIIECKNWTMFGVSNIIL